MLTLYLSLIETQEEKDKFEYIYVNFRKQMLNLAYKMVGNQYDAEDIVHSTFLSVSKNMHVFDGKDDSSIYSYLICATRGHAYNFYRKKANESKAVKRLSSHEDIDWTYTIDSKIDCDLFIEKIIDVIKELDELYSTVLYLYLVEDLSSKQIANLLDRKPDTVKKQITRGKQLLYSKLCERGLTNEG